MDFCWISCFQKAIPDFPWDTGPITSSNELTVWETKMEDECVCLNKASCSWIPSPSARRTTKRGFQISTLAVTAPSSTTPRGLHGGTRREPWNLRRLVSYLKAEVRRNDPSEDWSRCFAHHASDDGLRNLIPAYVWTARPFSRQAGIPYGVGPFLVP